jgi:glycosyltransferase involved in cell wall biosynthesis
VVCVSAALARRLEEREPSASAKVAVLPNAVPAEWVPGEPGAAPMAVGSVGALPRPLAGVLGRVSSRLRLDWLECVIEREPWLHWLFAGDVEQAEVTPEDRPRIRRLQRHPRCIFLGRRPFAEMQGLAAALDVAVLPYSDRSINPCASPVRLFVHLPWPAPILATPGCAQVAEFVPLVSMCGSAESLAARLVELRGAGFDDGQRLRRWQEASRHTWSARAHQWTGLLGGR